MSDAELPKTKHVLITTAVVVRMPEGETESLAHAEPLAEKMRVAIEDAFQGASDVHYPSAMSFLWLDETVENAGQCAKCECWVSDYTRSDALIGIGSGRSLGDHWLCDECDSLGE